MTPSDVEQALLSKAEEIRLAIVEENAKRDERIRTNHRALIWTRVVGAVAILVAVVGVAVGLSGRNALGRFRDQTTGNRVASCRQDVSRETNQAKAERAEIRKLTDLSDQPLVLVDAFLADYDGAVARAHPLRDCSSGGIAAFLAGHGGYLPLPPPSVPVASSTTTTKE